MADVIKPNGDYIVYFSSGLRVGITENEKNMLLDKYITGGKVHPWWECDQGCLYFYDHIEYIRKKK